MEFCTNVSAMKYLTVKLCLLDYKSSFCTPELPPMHSAFFLTKEPNQFHYFSSLCCWLLKLCDSNFIEWNEFDAPDAICTSIIRETNHLSPKKLNVNSKKLITGWGDNALLVLNVLCDCALLVKKIKYSSPKYPKTVEDEQDNDEEIEDEVLDDSLDDLPSDPDPSDGDLELEEGSAPAGVRGGRAGALAPAPRVDTKEWDLELEKASSKLRMKHIGNQVEWRAHFFKAQNHSKTLKENMTEVSQRLQKTQRRLQKQLTRIQNKETAINQEFQELKGGFSDVYKERDRLGAQFETMSASVGRLTEEMRKLSESIEHIKEQTAEQNTSMTDTSPLQKLRQTIEQIKDEIEDMNLRIAVQQFSVLRTKIQEGKENSP